MYPTENTKPRDFNILDHSYKEMTSLLGKHKIKVTDSIKNEIYYVLKDLFENAHYAGYEDGYDTCEFDLK